jgi:hypothetical protein
MAGIESVDRLEDHAKTVAASGRFTPEGPKAAKLEFVLRDSVPNLHKARRTIAKAKAEVADRKSKFRNHNSEGVK